MDGISWTDLDEAEQRTIAMLMDGVSTDLCDPVALETCRAHKGLPIDASGRPIAGRSSLECVRRVIHVTACPLRRSRPKDEFCA
jgi:hypothetical protein